MTSLSNPEEGTIYKSSSRHKSKRTDIICPKSSRSGSKNLTNDKNPISGCFWLGADRERHWELGVTDMSCELNDRASLPNHITKAVHFTVRRYDSSTNSV